ncbi:MAG TPA: GyrI-like domain-containing protein [Chlorobaculum sp.]|nr:GyrI-like domain-containing protein [Chlorobaculum sp.]
MNHQSVAIVDFPETTVAVKEHRGDPELIGKSVMEFIEWRRLNHLHPSVGATFNILYGDPAGSDSENYRIDLCVAVEREMSDPHYGIVPGSIPAGRCAVMRHIGTDDGLGARIRQFLTEWLPDSGEQMRDYPMFLQRVRFYPEVPEIEAISDIFLPIE